jgi:hypothetical protein
VLEPQLVVEGYISNLSYTDYQNYPTDPRYFWVKLRKTSIVSNVLDEFITDATVSLISEQGLHWNYQLRYQPTGEPLYILQDDDFKAQQDVGYKLQVILSNGEFYETPYQYLPQASLMGDLSYRETTKNLIKYIKGEQELVTVQGVDLSIDLPPSTDIKNYRWDFLASYIFIAPNAQETSPFKTCWVTDVNYLKQFELLKHRGEGGTYNLAFIETATNERLAHELTLFVRLQVLSDEAYLFWSEIEDQLNTGGLFDAPPHNVRTNIIAKGHNKKAFGFFYLIHEDAKRWYITPDDLTYPIDFPINCSDPMVPFDANVCINCFAVSNGDPNNLKPMWWR